MHDGHALLVILGMPPRKALAVVGDDVAGAAPLCVARLTDLSDDASPDRHWETVVVVASSYARLRRDSVGLDRAGHARRVIVHVSDRRPPWWRLTAPTGVTTFDTRLTSHLGTRTEAVAMQAVPVRLVAAAAAGGAPPSALRPGSGLRVAVAGPLTWEWAVDEPSAHLLNRAERAWDDRASRTPPYDVHVQRNPSAPTRLRFDRPGLDTAVVNPAGFRPGAPDGPATVTVRHNGLALATRHRVVRLNRDLLLTTATIRRLRRLEYVDLRGAEGSVPIADLAPGLLARLVTVLAGLGVPVVSGALPGAAREVLHPELAREVESTTPEDMATAAARESVSIRQRRLALRTHSASAGWQQIRAHLGLPRMQPTVSVVAATRRPEFLPHLLRTVAAQRNVLLEAIVVTHGFDAAPPTSTAGHEENVTFVRAPDDAPLGELLALASSMADGDVIAKMDDDDWYGAHHLEDLLQAMSWSGAMLAGAPNEHVYLADLDVTVTRPRPTSADTAARYLAGPTLMIRRDDLRGLGGWRHQPASVDLALLRAVQESGGMVTRIHGQGFVLCRHSGTHTWLAGRTDFLDDAAAVVGGFVPPPEVQVSDDVLEHYAAVRANAPARHPGHARSQPVSRS